MIYEYITLYRLVEMYQNSATTCLTPSGEDSLKKKNYSEVKTNSLTHAPLLPSGSVVISYIDEIVLYYNIMC